MAITIPTCELRGIIADVASFALDDDEFPDLNCVRIHWDGEMLHAQAHDGQHLAWSRWSPDDDPDEEVQESLTEPWGGVDEPWSVVITLAHAKELLKTYKVNSKLMWTPLGVEEQAGNLRVTRNRVPGLTAITTTVDGQPVRLVDFAEVLAKHDGAQAVRNVTLTASQVAHFAEVRPRGPLELTFTGSRSPVLVSVGERFTGAINPVRSASELRAVA